MAVFIQSLAIDGSVALSLVLLASLALVVLCLLFGASALVLRVRNDRNEARTRRLQAEWLPILLKGLNWEIKPEQVRNAVSPDDHLDFLDLAYRVGRQLRGVELDTLRTIAQPFLQSCDLPINRRSAESRARRIQILGLLGLRDCADEIKKALDDPSPLVRMVSARALVRKEHPENVLPVIARLERFRDWNPEVLASLIASVGGEAAPPLRETLADGGQSVWNRSIAADTLGRLNDVPSAGIAADVLSKEPDRTLVPAMLRLIERTGTQEHAAVVAPWTEAAEEPIRAAAIRALGSVGPDDALFLKALDDASHWVAFHAAQGLRRKDLLRLRDVADSAHPRAQLAQQMLVRRSEAV